MTDNVKTEALEQEEIMGGAAVEADADNADAHVAKARAADQNRPTGKYDLARLRASSTTGEKAGIERPLLTVPVKKPNKQLFFRTHPDPDYLPPMFTIEDNETRDYYLLANDMAMQLPGECRLVTFTPYITRQGVLMLWPLPMPEPDGRTYSAHISARQAAALARNKWVRMVWNHELSAYDLHLSAAYGEPEWRDVPAEKLLELAFGDGRYVEDPEHPLIRKLLGR